MSLAGVDEAGRGPVLGPLVVAAVFVDDERELRKLGVRDSKLLAPSKREALAPEILRVAKRVEIRVVGAPELNLRMPSENLNVIEVAAFAELIERLAPRQAVLDACDVDAARFGRNVAARVTHKVDIRAEHGADATHAVVAAASIVAKVERDRLMAELSAEHGECGSGYPHDVVTQRWLAEYVRVHAALPPFARREWETSKRLLQRDLSQFFVEGSAPAQGSGRLPAKPKKASRRSSG